MDLSDARLAELDDEAHFRTDKPLAEWGMRVSHGDMQGLLAEVRSSRVKPVLTTQAEMDVLPIGSVVRDGEGDHVAEKVHGGDDTGWHCTDGCWFGGEELLPATVLDTPVSHA